VGSAAAAKSEGPGLGGLGAQLRAEVGLLSRRQELGRQAELCGPGLGQAWQLGGATAKKQLSDWSTVAARSRLQRGAHLARQRLKGCADGLSSARVLWAADRRKRAILFLPTLGVGRRDAKFALQSQGDVTSTSGKDARIGESLARVSNGHAGPLVADV